MPVEALPGLKSAQKTLNEVGLTPPSWFTKAYIYFFAFISHLKQSFCNGKKNNITSVHDPAACLGEGRG